MYGILLFNVIPPKNCHSFHPESYYHSYSTVALQLTFHRCGKNSYLSFSERETMSFPHVFVCLPQVIPINSSPQSIHDFPNCKTSISRGCSYRFPTISPRPQQRFNFREPTHIGGTFANLGACPSRTSDKRMHFGRHGMSWQISEVLGIEWGYSGMVIWKSHEINYGEYSYGRY